MKDIQSCLTLCDPMDYIVHGIVQTRVLDWGAFPFSWGSSQHRDRTQVSRPALQEDSLPAEPQGKPLLHVMYLHIQLCRIMRGIFKINFLPLSTSFLLFLHAFLISLIPTFSKMYIYNDHTLILLNSIWKRHFICMIDANKCSLFDFIIIMYYFLILSIHNFLW